MSGMQFYSLNDAASILSANRNLVTFLVADRGIPVRCFKGSKLIDNAGLERLRREVESYMEKSRNPVLVGA